MAFAIPVLILMVFGLFEFSRIYMIQHLLQDAARVGCRNAVMQGSTNTKIIGQVTQTLRCYGIQGAEINLLVNNQKTDITNAIPNDQITMQILVSSSSVTVVPNGFFCGSLTATSSRRKY